MYLDKKYFNDDNFRKISLKHIIEIASARIEEITNILFNQNNNLNYLKNKDIPIYLDFTDKNISNNFKKYFKSYLDKYNLKIDNLNDDDPYSSIEIFGTLLSKGWVKEAIPIIHKKKSWISRIFSRLFE